MDFNMIHEDWEKEAPKLAAIERENPFDVPENYFEALKNNIETLARTEALKEQVKNDGFKVPDNYFLTLKEKTTAKVFEKRKPLLRKLNSSFIKYAAAACIVLATSIGFLLREKQNNLEKQLSRIPDSEIVNYLQAHADAGDTPFIIENLSDKTPIQIASDVSDEDLENYINSTSL